MIAVDRVRKHRASFREQQYQRFEVCLGLGLIERVRALAKAEKKAVWEVVEEALCKYTEGSGDGSNQSLPGG
jgi:hypothetical protein